MPFSQLILRVSGFGFRVPGFCFRVLRFSVSSVGIKGLHYCILQVENFQCLGLKLELKFEFCFLTNKL